jgi:hypothetical protein
VSIDHPLQAMMAVPQWIVCRVVPAEPKPRKLPINHKTGSAADAHDPSIWMPYAEAHAFVTANPEYMFGFVFAEAAGFIFVDLDNCIDAEGNWSQTALDVLALFPGAAVEISHSKKGAHIFCRGKAPLHSCKNIPLGLELYTDKRFALITFNVAKGGDSGIDLTERLPYAVEKYFPPKVTYSTAEWTTEPVPEWDGPEDDDILLKRAFGAKASANQVFGGKATFEQIYKGDEEALEKSFPDHGPQGRSYDASSADAALAQHLAFWTGSDAERMARMMNNSALVRPKYDREDYLRRTIVRAISLQNGAYKQRREKESVTAAPVDPEPKEDEYGEEIDMTPEILSGFQYLAATQQIEHFNGCIYVQDAHAVLTPSGMLLDQGRFNAVYNGYSFQMDPEGNKDSKQAWEALTASRIVRYPTVHSTCFKPAMRPGAVTQKDGIRSVNTYVPISTPRKHGDPTKFLDFLEKIIPDARDREILISYLASCLQNLGHKNQWAPLIIGGQGNGKTMITRLMIRAIGSRYSHMPKAIKLDSEFNAWLATNIFIGVEDIYVPGARTQLFETLKPMITSGDGIEIQRKGIDQTTADTCCNFLFNSNHKDALKLTENDRRICVIHTRQQCKEDNLRDGLTEEYFFHLYNWMDDGGYAIVAQYLEDYDIKAELDPAKLCQWAPKTTSTGAAIADTMGVVEQEVMEAVSENRTGFSGGWISSLALDMLLQENRMNTKVSRNKRKGMLESLGYIQHPGLPDGRANRAVKVDGGKKPRLFVRKGHISLNTSDPSSIVGAYERAQSAQVIEQMTTVFQGAAK